MGKINKVLIDVMSIGSLADRRIISTNTIKMGRQYYE